MLRYGAAFQCSGSSSPYRSLNQCNPASMAPSFFREGRGERCKLRSLSESACRHNVGQVELPPVGYITQTTVRGRVNAASLKDMPVFATT